MSRWLLNSLGVFLLLTVGIVRLGAQPIKHIKPEKGGPIMCGAERMSEYLPLLEGKRVALLINQTSVVGEELLLDALLEEKVNIVKVFVPEHGFRGNADAGAHVASTKDQKTGLPIISLYGSNKKPKAEQLKDIDILIYDLQDVGTRFYTYISTLEYVMEACAESNKEAMVLDRPNPNGHYVDGPVLEDEYRSFVGMQPIPVVYGMTAGEYAKMLQGEKWISGAAKLKLTVIPCANYDHTKKYQVSIPPSPNLKTMAAIYLYPSLCLFEGTVVSVGRGTDMPFQQWGNPEFKGKSKYSFIPQSTVGASKPMFEGKKCYGELIAQTDKEALKENGDMFNIAWLLKAYEWYPNKSTFFNSNNFFDKLAGTSKLQKQIKSGMKEEDIRASWQKDIDCFMKVRKKYLLYPDFE